MEEYSVHGYIRKGRRQPYKVEEIVFAESYKEAEDIVRNELRQIDVSIERLHTVCLTNSITTEERMNLDMPDISGMSDVFGFRVKIRKYAK